MKKTLLLVVLTAFSCCLMAQGWDVQFGKSSTDLKGSLLGGIPIIRYMGSDDTYAYLVTSNKIQTKLQLQKYDRDMNLIAEEPVEYRRLHTEYQYGYLNGNTLDILRGETGKEGDVITHLQYDASTLKQIGEEEIVRFKSEDNIASALMQFTRSQSTDWISILYLEPHQGEPRLNAIMLGRDLKPLWKMSGAPWAFNSQFVTDSAELVMGGYTLPKGGSGTTRVRFVVMDGENEVFYDGNVNTGRLVNFRIVRYSNGVIYCVGALYADGQREKDTRVSGYYALTYDTHLQDVVNYEEFMLTDDDVNIICNDDLSNKVKEPRVHYTAPADFHYDDQGATALYDRLWDVYRRDKYGNREYQTTVHSGMIAFRVDNQGHIQWHRAIRHNVSFWDPSGYWTTPRLLHAGNMDYIFTYESEKNLKKKPGKSYDFVRMKRQQFNFYAIGIDGGGNVNYELLGGPKQGLLMGAPHPMDGGYILNMISLKECAIGVLRAK